MGKHKVPFKSALDEAEAIDEKIAVLRLRLQTTPISDSHEKTRLASMICDAQKMALRLRIGSDRC